MILRQFEQKNGEGPRLEHTTRESRADRGPRRQSCVEIFGVGEGHWDLSGKAIEEASITVYSPCSVLEYQH